MAINVLVINMPTLQNGEIDIYSEPDLTKRKLYVYPLETGEVVSSVVRNRLRRRFNGQKLKVIETFFRTTLPEYGNYTVNELITEVDNRELNPSPGYVSSYVNKIDYFVPTFNTSAFIEKCYQLTGNGPISRSNFVQVLYLTSMIANNIIRRQLRKIQTAQIISNLLKSCGELLSSGDYQEYIKEYPWHTWYNPLETFPVTIEEVVKSIVRHRLAELINLRYLSYKDIYERFPHLSWMMKKSLPEFNSYQIRCIIDELEDLDRTPQTFDLAFHLWLAKFYPAKNFLNEYHSKVMEVFNSDPGPEGILKILLFTCILIEKFVTRNLHRRALQIMEALTDIFCQSTFYNLLFAHPWHTWYTQELPCPNGVVQRRATAMPKFYGYPKFTYENRPTHLFTHPALEKMPVFPRFNP